MNAVWLISGIPGAGKTTTARALASRLKRAAFIETDAVQSMIVAGGHPPSDLLANNAHEAERQLLLRTRICGRIAAMFCDGGFSAVIDDVVVSPGRWDAYRAAIGDWPTHLVMLAPSLEVALERDRLRPEKTVAEQWAHLDETMRTNALPGLRLDTSKMTVDEVVAAILRALPQAR